MIHISHSLFSNYSYTNQTEMINHVVMIPSRQSSIRLRESEACFPETINLCLFAYQPNCNKYGSFFIYILHGFVVFFFPTWKWIVFRIRCKMHVTTWRICLIKWLITSACVVPARGRLVWCRSQFYWRISEGLGASAQSTTVPQQLITDICASATCIFIAASVLEPPKLSTTTFIGFICYIKTHFKTVVFWLASEKVCRSLSLTLLLGWSNQPVFF